MEMKSDVYRVASSMFGTYRDAAVFAKSRAIPQHDIEAYVPAIGWTTKYQRPNVAIEKESILAEAARITRGDRQNAYGPPDQDFARTAKIWEALLESCVIDGRLKIEPRHVALCMIAIKLSRETHQQKRDNWVDIAGYAHCGNVCSEAAKQRIDDGAAATATDIHTTPTTADVG
jgi:hypothetical protein